MGIKTNSGTTRGRSSSNDDAFKPILDTSNDIVHGELVVQLHRDAAASITSSIAVRGGGMTEGAATTFGVAAIDTALGKLKVVSLSRLHPPAPMMMSESVAAAAVPMGDTFHIRYASEKTVKEAVASLAGVKGVEMVEAVRYRETLTTTPNDPQFGSQWGLRRIHCPDAWDRTRGSAAITVAVIDTGVDLDHPDLQPLIVPGYDFVNLGTSPTPPAGFHFEGDFNTPDNDPMDEVGHGTHVAGTIACLTNNALGVAGVTWACHIMPVRVLARIVSNSNPNDVRGTGSSVDIANGIRYATDHGARVINMSLGGPSDTQVERDAVAYAIAHGVVVCAAMGNAFLQGNPTSYPGAYPDVVAVGAIDNADHRAAFSQTGPHIDVSGPGVGILSTVWNNSYTTMSGTSMATPHAAGVAALILSIKPSLTSAQCADILRHSCDPLRDNPGDPVPNNNYGWGCVNALAAVNMASPPVHSVPIFTCPVPSVVTVCQTHSIACPSVQINCPSVITICQTHTVTCPSVQVNCPSVITVCPSHTVICTPTNPITCNVQSRPVICTVTGQIQCVPSNTVGCPSGPVCGAQSLACGQSVACHPGLPGGGHESPGGGAGFGVDDPYGTNYAPE
jgi:subtilisin family serine protease